MQNSYRVCIYVLGFNDSSMAQAYVRFPNRAVFRPTYIPTTMYFESIMYGKLLMERVEEWDACDYVGTLSYKAPDKLKEPCVAAIIEQQVQDSKFKEENPDIVSFLCLGTGTDLLKQAEASHRGFTKLWSILMTKLGYQQSDYKNKDITPFFCNYWMAKPHWMKQYIEFYKRVEVLLETDNELKALLMQDARYRSGSLNRQRCMEVFGKPYYTFHCFICERLCCFYFWKQGARIKHMTIKQ